MGQANPPDIALTSGSFNAARALNWNTAAQAHRYVYHHPDDSLGRMVGNAQELPPPRDALVASDANLDLRDRLVAMSEWAYANPDKPYPLYGVGGLPEPPPGARTVAVDGRTRRIRYVQDRLGDI